MKVRLNKITNAELLWNYAFVLTLIVYAIGFLVPIMQDDAAVYAEISREMFAKGNYLEIFKNGADWLDKPHFQFWITAAFFKLFGVNTFAYKLPGVIFTLAAALFTYFFASEFYSRKHGFIAALIFITAQHIVISVNDVRAEPFLTFFTIAGLYFFAVYLKYKRNWNLAAGCLCLGCLMMTKGLFTIIPVVTGIGLSLLYARKWREIFNLQWLVAGILAIVFTFPSLYAYYRQFDLHPEKVIFGQHNVSGIKFFLWTSQWGRFTNTGPIVKSSGSVFYFLHTILWAFAPWALIGFFAIINKTKLLFQKINTSENYTYFGFIFLFIIFSFSGFQLSFYLNPILPLLSILCTATLFSFKKNTRVLRAFSGIQLGLCLLVIGAVYMLNTFSLDRYPSADSMIILLAGIVIASFIFFKKQLWLKKIIFAPAIVFLSVNYYLNRDFYPSLFQYQSEDSMIRFVKQNNIPVNELATVDVQQSVINFHLQSLIPQYNLDEGNENNLKGRYVYTTVAGLEKMESLNMHTEVVTTFSDFHITKLTPVFLNKKTRSKALKKRFLVKVD